MDKTLDPEDRYLVPGLMRGLQVLGAFTPERPEMSLSEIARALGLSRSAAFRSVYTLAEMGFLLQDARSKAYHLGPAVMRLGYGYMANRELVEVALPALEALRDATDWSTHLGVRDGAKVLYMLRAASRMGLGSIVHVGSRLPAATTTMGRVLLAELDAATLTALYRDEPAPMVQGGARRGLSDILAQAQRDAAAGVVVQVGSFEAGIASVAAPIRDLSGATIAAINATRALEAGEAVPEDVIAALRDTARAISRELGGA